MQIISDLQEQKSLGRRILFLDEVNFTKASISKVEWSNKNANIDVDQERVYGGYVSCCAVIAEGTGIEALAIQKKAFNQQEFIRFLYWIAFMNNYEYTAIFMDNLAVHKTKLAMDAYKYLSIVPIFNLAYSPDYNPIESVFSQVKRIYKSKRLNRLANNKEFDAVWEVEDAFYKVPPSKIDPCIGHSMKLLEDLDALA